MHAGSGSCDVTMQWRHARGSRQLLAPRGAVWPASARDSRPCCAVLAAGQGAGRRAKSIGEAGWTDCAPFADRTGRGGDGCAVLGRGGRKWEEVAWQGHVMERVDPMRGGPAEYRRGRHWRPGRGGIIRTSAATLVIVGSPGGVSAPVAA